MGMLTVFVCENISRKLQRVIADEGITDVVIAPFPCLCEKAGNKGIAENILQRIFTPGEQGVILCGKKCGVLNCLPKGSCLELRLLNSCFNHLASDELIKYFLDKGGYIVGLGWLNNWSENMAAVGFHQESARHFYQGFCKELVYFDASSDFAAEAKMQALSHFLDLPYVIMHMELDEVEVYTQFIIHQWQTLKKSQEHTASLTEVETKLAEYSAILDLMGKISIDINKRDAIAKIKDIFVMIMGIRQFKYWHHEMEHDSLPEEIRQLFSECEKKFLIFHEANRFCIKIEQNGRIFGAIDVRDFLFPQYLEKYLNFSLEIAKICGLLFFNIAQHEALLKSESELQYLSGHDPLTGLHNRFFLEEMSRQHQDNRQTTVFVIGIDQLQDVNEQFGQLEGDKLIRSLAEILKNCFREKDILARSGGDQFAAVLANCTAPMVKTFINRINDNIAVDNQNNPAAHLKINISLGYIMAKNNEQTLEDLIREANLSMLAQRVKEGAQENDLQTGQAKKIGVILIDDEIPALQELQYQLKSYPQLEILASLTDSAAALEKIIEDQPDLIFLDINMPGINGIEFAQKIQGISPQMKIVFVTAYQEFAVQAFEVHALDYLLKPIVAEQLQKTMARIVAPMKERRMRQAVMENIIIKCFGRFSISKSGRVKEIFKWRTSKSKELFLYLLLHQGDAITKNELVSALFEGIDLKKAYNNLYVSMYYLRKSIEEFGIDRSMLLIKDDYSVEVKAGICDFIDFLNCPPIDAAMPEESIAPCLDLLNKYQGAFLDSEDYPWAETMRGHLEMKYEAAALGLAEACLRGKRQGSAENILQQLLLHQPLSEDAYRKLLDVYIDSQQAERFSKVYKQYEQMMRDELGLPPEKKYTKHFLQSVYPSLFKAED